MKAKKAHPNLLIIIPHKLVLGQAVFSSAFSRSAPAARPSLWPAHPPEPPYTAPHACLKPVQPFQAGGGRGLRMMWGWMMWGWQTLGGSPYTTQASRAPFPPSPIPHCPVLAGKRGNLKPSVVSPGVFCFSEADDLVTSADPAFVPHFAVKTIPATLSRRWVAGMFSSRLSVWVR
jgi:hypothetical protein